nr:toprim domain-containing protein [uncultured Dyadobacter sp.]
MDFRKQTVSVQQAKETDLVDYLYELGYQPARISASSYWYHSPLRTENTPSFKVNRKINRWYDFGLGKGGNLIDFGILYHGCTVGELLQDFGHSFPLHQQVTERTPKEVDESTHIVSVMEVSPVHSKALVQYLSQRKISLKIANQFCQQVSYQIAGKQYFALGFKNDSGGFELRNPFSKISSSPKDITSIDNGRDTVSVFEGFFDLMSFAQTTGSSALRSQNYVVLNSISFFEKARQFLESHGHIKLYLDNDQPGLDLTRRALVLDSRYQDASSLYQNHKDLNEWLITTGRSQEKSQKLKIANIPC